MDALLNLPQNFWQYVTQHDQHAMIMVIVGFLEFAAILTTISFIAILAKSVIVHQRMKLEKRRFNEMAAVLEKLTVDDTRDECNCGVCKCGDKPNAR